MSVAESARYIGTQASMPVENGELTVLVTVRDVKVSFGNVRMLVEPVNGTGTKWVNANRLSFN